MGGGGTGMSIERLEAIYLKATLCPLAFSDFVNLFFKKKFTIDSKQKQKLHQEESGVHYYSSKWKKNLYCYIHSIGSTVWVLQFQLSYYFCGQENPEQCKDKRG